MGSVFNELKKIREANGYSEYRTAKELGIKIDTVKDIENGKGNIKTIIKIAKLFGHELFLREKENKNEL